MTNERRRDSWRMSRSLALFTVASLATVSVAGALPAVADSHGNEIPEWQKLEPKSYDTSPTPPEQAARVATPEDTRLDALNGEILIAWWLLKDPKNPRHSLILVESEPNWKQPRKLGQSGPVNWTMLDEENATEPQPPFLNGMFSFKHGVPLAGSTPDVATIDGLPGLRSRSLNFNYRPDSNSWQVQAKSPVAEAAFSVDQVTPGSRGSYFPPDGKTVGPTNVDAVINGRVSGYAKLNGRDFNVDGWRAEYWRMNMFPSVMDSQANPATSWRGWEWNNVMEPDGGASQYYAMIDPNGRAHGYLVDARPSGTRVCSKITVKFDDYYYGKSLFGDVSPPFQRYTIPGRIKVKCAPDEPVQMEKTFYPDSKDYADLGFVAGTEMPMHTVPGSFGTYEHMRYTTYRNQLFQEAIADGK